MPNGSSSHNRHNHGGGHGGLPPLPGKNLFSFIKGKSIETGIILSHCLYMDLNGKK